MFLVCVVEKMIRQWAFSKFKLQTIYFCGALKQSCIRLKRNAAPSMSTTTVANHDPQIILVVGP
jgi:hypothetical protein